MALSTKLFLVCLFVACLTGTSPAQHSDVHRRDYAAMLAPVPVQEPTVFPIAVNSPAPEYPASARKDSVQGTVWVEAVVDASGRVQNAKIRQGVRWDLDAAALTALWKWTFRPALQKGKSVDCSIIIPFHFKLRR